MKRCFIENLDFVLLAILVAVVIALGIVTADSTKANQGFVRGVPTTEVTDFHNCHEEGDKPNCPHAPEVTR